MIRIFIGIDPRQPIAYHVLSSSIIRRCSEPVSITPIMLETLPISRKGLTEFTYSRYMVPWLCSYEGKAIFMDSDMILRGDISELMQYADSAVSVVPFAGKLSFERPSLMVFDCAKCTNLTPAYIDDESSIPQSLEWAETVGEIPEQWNFLVGYSDPQLKGVKLVHYTQGVPGYKECRNTIYADDWFAEKEAMLSHVSWLEIMGNSVHAAPVLSRLRTQQ